MNRKEFMRVCSILGLSISFQSVLSTCTANQRVDKTYSGSPKVIIIGAGAAGLTAAYLLAQKGFDFTIIEASDSYGGRLKKTDTFVDFPIPLGAEWLHTSILDLERIVNDLNAPVDIKFKDYEPQDFVGHYEDGILTLNPIYSEFGNDFADKKFISSSWLDFYEAYILPSIHSKIRFNSPITTIDYTGSNVVVRNENGENFECDKLIVTVPLKILQENYISFKPSLPEPNASAIQQATVWNGVKVFMEFTTKFYPAYLTFPPTESGAIQRVYYDAAYGQNSNSNVLGLLVLGDETKPYQQLSHSELKEYVLSELDAVFDGAASTTYIKHIAQDWGAEPFIRGAYLADTALPSISKKLSRTVKDKLYFAGEAYTKENDWGGVHNAARTAKRVVDEIGRK